VIGPWAAATRGKPSAAIPAAAATAAPLRNVRRGVSVAAWDSFMKHLLVLVAVSRVTTAEEREGCHFVPS
jgi:hypothetical protein